MQHSKDINTKAWAIRRNAAKRFNCSIMEVSWSACLQQAKECSVAYLDIITRRHTASSSFEDLLTVHESYNPTLYVCHPDKMILANAFDKCARAFGMPNRIYRCNTSNKPNIKTGFPDDMETSFEGDNKAGRDYHYQLEIKENNYKQIVKEMQY